MLSGICWLWIKGPYARQRVRVAHFPTLCLGPESFVAFMPKKKGTDRKSSLPEFAHIQVISVWHSTFHLSYEPLVLLWRGRGKQGLGTTGSNMNMRYEA